MFINISNHPSTGWSQEQLKAAFEFGKEIIDLPFPEIDPIIGSNELSLLVDKYITVLGSYKDPDMVVHIVGEPTFTFQLVTILKKSGILCVASTTKREVIANEDGTFTKKFNFGTFRLY